MTKKNKIIILSVLSLLLLFILFKLTDLNLKGEKLVEVSYLEEYKEPGYISLLPVKIKGKVKNEIGTYKLVYKSLFRSRTRTIKIVDDIKPTLELVEGNLTLLLNEEYIEYGAKAFDEIDGELKIDIKSGVNINKEGIYKVTYTTTDKSGNKTKLTRQVNVVNTLYKEEYDQLDNNVVGFSSGNNQDYERPNEKLNNELKKQNTYLLGEDSKKVYLTFDEGNVETYLKEIVEILDKYEIKATFFLCKGYINRNPDFVKSLVNNGHSIGNHTVKHLSMPSLSTKENFDSFISEIKQTEIAFKQATGKNMEKLFRYPMGEYSSRTLTAMNDLGYKSYFWSADYKDWDKEYEKDYALSSLIKRLHNGAIYLIHPKQKANYLALEDFILFLQDEGYEFDLVKNIK